MRFEDLDQDMDRRSRIGLRLMTICFATIFFVVVPILMGYMIQEATGFPTLGGAIVLAIFLVMITLT